MAARQTAIQDEHAERRHWPRHELEEPPILTVLADGRSYDCQVIDLSLGGARLRFTGDKPRHGEFTLQHHTAGDLRCKRTWRRNGVAGIAFHDPDRMLERLLQCICLMLEPVREDAGSAPLT
jgi:hypothetical protein